MRIDLLDVFISGPLTGNPLAVVHGGEALSEAQMLRLTQWIGFSETTFLLPPTQPGADYRVRIFYPAGELPFAGHPTLGTCHAWLAAGGKSKREGVVVQECGIGLVEVRQTGDTLAFRAPELLHSGPLNEGELEAAITCAGVPREAVVAAVHVDNGPRWQLLRLRSAEDVLAATPVARAPTPTDIGLAGPCGPGSSADWELRAFFADHKGAFIEDPVTGSLNAGVAMHLFGAGLAQGSYIAAQGRQTGGDGRIACRQDADGSIWISGRVATIAAGGALSGLA